MLEVRELCVRYGTVNALSDLCLDVAAGQITGLVGPNGAGKTTAIDAINGLVRCSGRVTFDGEDVSRRPTHGRSRRGMTRTFQRDELFEGLTVQENLQVGVDAAARARVGAAFELGEVAAMLDLTSVLGRYPAELSHGVRRLVGLGRALAQRPLALLLDEPAAGLDREESRRLGARLRQVADRGVAVLLVDHDTDLVFNVCDTVAVLVLGQLLEHGPAAEVRSSQAVSDAYLGASPASGASAGAES